MIRASQNWIEWNVESKREMLAIGESKRNNFENEFFKLTATGRNILNKNRGVIDNSNSDSRDSINLIN